MITLIIFLFKGINQAGYNKIIENLDLTKIPCKCGHSHYVKNGTYKRTVIFVDLTIEIKVQRVMCKSCKHTHGILPEAVVPYQRISADVQRIVIQLAMGSPEVDEIMDSNPDITEVGVLAARMRFKRHWNQRLKVMGMDLRSSISDLIQSSINWFERQFLQIRSLTNLFFCPSTQPK